MSFEQLRRQYTMGGLHESDLDADPIAQFHQWMKAALENSPADWVEPYAMTLSTADPTGRVSSRIVLLRGADHGGFAFYTNYDSDKGQQLRANPQASLTFYWGYLERQVRIEGTVSRLERSRADAYFHNRPRGSQLSAAISPQSQPIGSRESLEQAVRELDTQLEGAEVPLPDNWGGYLLAPSRLEFWQGRENRLHDRLVYERVTDGWILRRLAP